MKATTWNNFPLVSRRLRQIPRQCRDAVAVGMDDGLRLIVGTSNRKYLSGPRPLRLGVVTGRLRRSISRAVKKTAQAVLGIVGTNVPYARKHELGFKGVESVRAHLRVVGAKRASGRRLDMAKARRPIRDRAGNLLGFRRTSKTAVSQLAGVGTVQVAFVRAHKRRVNVRKRPFLQPAIKENLKKVEAAILRRVRAHIKRTTGRTA